MRLLILFLLFSLYIAAASEPLSAALGVAHHESANPAAEYQNIGHSMESIVWQAWRVFQLILFRLIGEAVKEN